jgi:hypothetical protein
MVSDYWANLASMAAYVGIIVVTCLTTATLALFMSVLFRKTSVSLMTAYLVIVLLFAAPIGVQVFAKTFFENDPLAAQVEELSFISPVLTAFCVPLDLDRPDVAPILPRWPQVITFAAFYLALNVVLLLVMSWLFQTRWRVAY